MKDELMKFLNEHPSFMLIGEKVLITPKLEAMEVGTIKTEHGTIQICVDQMLPPNSMYLMNKEDFDRRYES